MANQTPAKCIFHYQTFTINKSQPLGHGSYGAVYEAKCDQLSCAAKVLHPTILDPNDPGAAKIMQRFQQECAFLENIRHPNIVQYLGMTRDPESRLPVLLMELLDESLTKMLEHSQRSLAYYVQVNICHDVALAVAYLHSNNIIHRDLSSNNVLIIGGRRAKVTDFGMSKLVGAAPSMTPLTTCPGTLVYMPPEALDEPSRYTEKLDCFSEGVIMIQVCTRLWPKPGPRIQTISDSRSPTGVVQVPVLEVNRRRNHIDMINRGHGLVPIVVDCLHYRENERPSSEELCQRLAYLKETREYRGSIENDQRLQNDIAELERQTGELQLREATIKQLHGEIQAKDVQIGQLRKQLQPLNQRLGEQEQLTTEVQLANHRLQKQVEQLQMQLSQQTQQNKKLQLREVSKISQMHGEILQQQSEIQAKDAHIEQLEKQLDQLNQHLGEKEQEIAKVKLAKHSLQTQVEQLQRQLRTKELSSVQAQRRHQHDSSLKESQSQSLPLHVVHPPNGQLVLGEWRDGGRAPFEMARGNVVVQANVVYFMNFDGKGCSYNLLTKMWSGLPECPSKYAGLVIVQDLLTAVGGGKGIYHPDPENKLLSLRGKKWVERFPAMPTKRYSAAAVTIGQHLVVAGGQTGMARYLNTVEVMDTETLTWSAVANLPRSIFWTSATICGDRLYVLGGFDKNDSTTSMLTCSLEVLLHSCSEISPDSVWQRIADVPVHLSTCVAINEDLVAVGGRNKAKEITAAVHKFNPTTDSWDLISYMPTGRYDCLVTLLPTNEIIIVGGYAPPIFSVTDVVEIATVTYI